jgi:hypothetical protein
MWITPGVAEGLRSEEAADDGTSRARIVGGVSRRVPGEDFVPTQIAQPGGVTKSPVSGHNVTAATRPPGVVTKSPGGPACSLWQTRNRPVGLTPNACLAWST